MREAFAMQKLLHFFNKKYWHIWDIKVWNFNETITNDVVSFEQPDPDLQPCTLLNDIPSRQSDSYPGRIILLNRIAFALS